MLYAYTSDRMNGPLAVLTLDKFIAKFGWLALQEGALLQLLEISFSGLLSLAFYLGFKACEVELMIRWRGLTLPKQHD